MTNSIHGLSLSTVSEATTTASGLSTALRATTAASGVPSPAVSPPDLAIRLLGLTESIKSPHDLISDLESGRIRRQVESGKASEREKELYIQWLRLSLYVDKVRSACTQAAVKIGPEISVFARNIAVTKLGVGLCHEKVEALFLNLMGEEAVEACGIMMTNLDPIVDNRLTHGFLALSMTRGRLPVSIIRNPGMSLENFLSTYQPYLVDPLLRWHGNFSDYSGSPLEEYLRRQGIVQIILLAPKLGKEFIPRVQQDSDRVFRVASGILPHMKNGEFRTGQELFKLGALAPEKM